MLNVGVFTVIRVLKAKVNQNSSVADPVHFLRSGFQNPDPDLVDPRRPDPDPT